MPLTTFPSREPLRRALLRLSIVCAGILIAAALTGCNTSTLGLSVSPASQTLTYAGQTAQLVATATNQSGSSPTTTVNVTSSATWTSSVPSIATVNSSGIVTAVGSGTTLITANYAGKAASASINVSTGSTTSSQPSLTIIPGSGAVTTYVGEVTQFLAIGTLTGGGVQQDLTNSVRWVSSDPSIATISQNGQATTVGVDAAAGSATITALATTSAGSVVTATTTLTTNLTSGSSDHPTLSIIPAGATSSFVGDTTQFIAIGNFGSGGGVQDLTNKVKWSSSDVAMATIDQAGLATSVNAGVPVAGVLSPDYTTTITAELTTVSGTVVTAQTKLVAYPYGSTSSTGKVNLPTLNLYKVGLGSGTVTSNPSGLICGTQASCTGNFTLGSQVILTATPASGSTFGGWSANCMSPVNGNPNQCAITMPTNETVGAIFN